MRIKPDDSWRWFYDAEQDRMMLNLAGSEPFCSRFSRKTLTPDAFNSTGFSVDDAALFFTFAERCRHAGLEEACQETLVLNALVATRFLKPMMPKSWHFVTQPRGGYRPDEGDLVSVTLSDSAEQATLMVVESGENAALCLLAQPEIKLAGRPMRMGEAIKIMNDRLQPHRRPDAVRFAHAV